MLDLEYLVTMESRNRHDIVYRRANLLAPLDRELQLGRAPARRVATAWAGNGLAAVGRRLTSLGERLAPPQGDNAQPSA